MIDSCFLSSFASTSAQTQSNSTLFQLLLWLRVQRQAELSCINLRAAINCAEKLERETPFFIRHQRLVRFQLNSAQAPE
jgi:hypothetical protein